MVRTALLLCFGLAASAAGRPWLAVVEKIGGNVGFYNPAGERVAAVKAGPVPHEIVLSPDMRFAYVSDNGILWMTDPGEGGNTITIIDLKSRSKAGVISLGQYKRPHGMDIDPKTNRMVVTVENPDGLVLVDLAQRKVLRKYEIQGEDPHMVVLGPRSEYAYVSCAATNTISAVQLASGKVKVIPTDKRPQGGVLSRDGKLLYFTNSDGNSISLIDTARNERVATIQTGRSPNRIALTPDGKTLVYSLSENGNAVGFADVASRKETKVIPLGGRPLSLTMSGDGLWAFSGVQDQDKVFVISVPERKIVQVMQTPKGAGPDPALPLP